MLSGYSLGGQTILSLTPLPASHDSRTVKIAASFARAGARSIIFENRRGEDIVTIPGVELRSLPPAGRLVKRKARDFIHTARAPIDTLQQPRRLLKAIRVAFHILRFVVLYLFVKPLVGAFMLRAADIYYVHEYRLFPTALLVRMLRGGLLVYDAHDLYDAVLPDSNWHWLERKLLLPLTKEMHRLAARRADLVVTTSRGMALVLADATEKPIRVVTNAHELRLDDTSFPGVREKLGISQDELVFVVVGHRKVGQVLEPTITALRRLPGTKHLVFVGRGYDVQALEKEESGLRVHCPGALAPSQIVPFIAGADLSLILYVEATQNYRVTLPNGLFQSIAAGVPVIYPNLPELAGVASRVKGCLIDPADPDSIEAAVVHMLADRMAAQLSGDMGGRITYQTISDFTWENEEKNLLDAVSEILKAQKCPPDISSA
jgi:glycosyltransferase involved in cell wall biosynthesis